ncbi:MAG: hypothetical protein M0T72_13475 [Candidatus Dormibacteraeota bacterium]|nr:hypothetical protein [Candidatus Dormibacteraeota bacterium]
MADVCFSLGIAGPVAAGMLALGPGARHLMDAAGTRLLAVPATRLLLGRVGWWPPASPHRLLPHGGQLGPGRRA